ncbi:MFS-type transporter involved in bile tolerance (Atg22 family) [Hasllibacter halocynthiae]|uniref:MFS-type transporter involved in bile tolerance (Atg22 family) n=1 Tax=Hasllibacter halocynthiae TaxID=595589 RepID=A0A2T0X2H0_9RHOB|nr:MFS transporter [Hasllibacter halocynthiae]PRY93140.1 MFS-type transporter involved in bile tolerance (Atg22 family) [Hasllibacter halocynthiae]
MRAAAAFVRENLRWLAAGALLAFVSSFGQTFFISVFAGEIRAAFALTEGEWGRTYALGTIASAAIVVFAGGLADTMPARRLGTLVFLGLAAACAFMAVVPAPLLPLAVLFLRFFGQGMSSHLAGVTMARWFTRTRGKALAFAGLGFALGESLLPMTFVAALPAFGARTLWLSCAALVLAAIPVLRALLAVERDPRAPGPGAADVPGADGRHWTRGEVLRSPLFWTLVPLLLGPPAFGTALFFLQVHLAAVKGWTHLGFVALFPAYTAVSVAASVGAGVLLDRIGTRRLISLAAVPMAAGFLLMAGAATLAGATLALMATALTTGANHTVVAAFWAERFGTRHLGAIRAMASAIMVLGSALGPWLTGALIDAGHDFPAQMGWIALYLLGAAGLAAAGLARAAPGRA